MTGTPFAQRFEVKRRGGVAYLALEGIGGLPSRLTAIARQRGCAQALPFAYRPDCPALTAYGKPYGVNNQKKRSAELRPSVRPSPTPLDPPRAGALPPETVSWRFANAASGFPRASPADPQGSGGGGNAHQTWSVMRPPCVQLL
jgi:hypothetical protein